MHNQIKEQIAQVVMLDHVITNDEDLLMSGVLDSISAMKLIARLEDTHGIAIPATDVTFENFQTVDAMVRYLKGRSQ